MPAGPEKIIVILVKLFFFIPHNDNGYTCFYKWCLILRLHFYPRQRVRNIPFMPVGHTNSNIIVILVIYPFSSFLIHCIKLAMFNPRLSQREKYSKIFWDIYACRDRQSHGLHMYLQVMFNFKTYLLSLTQSEEYSKIFWECRVRKSHCYFGYILFLHTTCI